MPMVQRRQGRYETEKMGIFSHDKEENAIKCFHRGKKWQKYFKFGKIIVILLPHLWMYIENQY